MRVENNKTWRRWTSEEEDRLREMWGNKSVSFIASHLDRSENAVINRVQHLKLPGFFECADNYVTKHFLMQALGYSRGSSGYMSISFIDRRGLPVHRIQRKKAQFDVIYLDEFWKWAKENQSFLNFSNFDKYALGPEPAWVNKKRRNDIQRSRLIAKTPWTPREEELLERYIKAGKYSYKQLSEKLHRTEGAIQRRIRDLGFTERPIKADNHTKWTDAEWATLGEMIKAGDNYEQMSDVLGRSSKAIRGRVFNMYLTERLDAVRAYIGTGRWGDGAPNKPLRYLRLMPPDEKEGAMFFLSVLARDLRMIAKDRSGVTEEYRDYWQKDVCMNWDNALGCTAREADCDSCVSFRRIPVQHCCRCGKDFFERKTSDFCSDCRYARLKAAQRKWAALHNKRR